MTWTIKLRSKWNLRFALRKQDNEDIPVRRQLKIEFQIRELSSLSPEFSLSSKPFESA